MENEVAKFIGYHSTSSNNALSILGDSFKICNISDFPESEGNDKFFTYWLGNGIYFFEDIDVARWYSKGKHGKYGSSDNSEPQTILESDIECSKCMDLRKVANWKKLIKDFDLFCANAGKHFVVSLNSADKGSNEYIDTKHQMRCLFFDWYHSYRDISMIVAAFNQAELDYIEKGQYSIEEFLDIYYTEVQYCIYDPSIIKHTQRYE